MKTNLRQQLANYYRQRARRLKTLKLDDVLPRDAFTFWSPEPESAPQVVSRLLEEYLTQFEDWWNVLLGDSESCAQIIQLRTESVPSKFLYKRELAKAHNRITREFLNQFSTTEDAIDWTALLRTYRAN